MNNIFKDCIIFLKICYVLEIQFFDNFCVSNYSEKVIFQNIVTKQHAMITNRLVEISFMRSVISLAILLSLNFYILRFNRNAVREEIE